MAKNDSGPAFPAHTPPYTKAGAHYVGMSLRDWFAGQAITAVVETAFMAKRPGGVQEFAAACYAMADAMLAERSK
jgi:hypothetical protein